MSHPFTTLGVPNDMIRGISELGIETPTKVQELAIPFLMKDGGDLIAQAQTGTGKTAAFGLPLLSKIDPSRNEIQALVVAPTRELAKQIGKQLFKFTKYTAKMFIEVVSGGDKMELQIAALKRPTHIVVATPGRLIEQVKRGALSLDKVKYLVLDEADEMLSMGFKKELAQILEWCVEKKSTWLFSATFPEEINLLIKDCMSPKAYSIQIDQAHVVNRDISHRFAICPRSEKTDFIAGFLSKQKEGRGLIFCRTKAGAINLCLQLSSFGFPTDVLHGDLTQKERDKVMRGFKKERFRYLVATDVAARGIDVEGLTFVLQHQLPEQIDSYTHRSGRTGRAGKKGVSLSLIEPKEKWMIARLESVLHVTFSEYR